jgi:hypothetical protein
MTKAGRYDVAGLVEAQYQPGSRGRVLRNLLSITSKRAMDEVEAKEQKRALKEMLSVYTLHHRFKASDICDMHKKKQQYFRAIQAGMDHDYEPMEKVFTDVIRRTLSGSVGP